MSQQFPIRTSCFNFSGSKNQTYLSIEIHHYLNTGATFNKYIKPLFLRERNPRDCLESMYPALNFGPRTLCMTEMLSKCGVPA